MIRSQRIRFPRYFTLLLRGQSLPYHVGATILPDPDLVEPLRIDIDSVANPIGLLLGRFILRKRDGQLPVEDQMRGQATVRMGRVICVPAPSMPAG